MQWFGPPSASDFFIFVLSMHILAARLFAAWRADQVLYNDHVPRWSMRDPVLDFDVGSRSGK